jgi:glucosamine-6-phosphate isomerase
MQLTIFSDYSAMSAAVAAEIIELIKNKPGAVLCLASGETPKLGCKLAAERAVHEQVDCSKITFIGLDEWVGISPENEGSCRFFFETLFIRPVGLAPSQTFLFNALSSDLQQECTNMDKLIADKGGIDLMIVGIGMNGHIGFNEPGVSFDKYSHVIDLDDTTKSVGQKYFKESMVLNRGITLGLKHLMESKKAIVIANGSKKADVVKRAVNEKVSNQFPATIIQQHPNGFVMVDQEAAALVV